VRPASAPPRRAGRCLTGRLQVQVEERRGQEAHGRVQPGEVPEHEVDERARDPIRLVHAVLGPEGRPKKQEAAALGLLGFVFITKTALPGV